MRPLTRKNNKWAAEVIEVVGSPNKTESVHEVKAQGARRPRVRMGPNFSAALTERQRVIMNNHVRVGRTWGRVLQMIEDTGITMEQFVEGLSNEELVRGQVKDKNGRFAGRPPQWVPRAFHRACLNELLRRGKTLWQENYLQAIEVMTQIANGQGAGADAPAKVRLQAAQFVIERLEGKVPEKVIIESEQPWQLVLDGIVAEADTDAVERGRKALNSAQAVRQELHDPRSEIVDAELVEEDEEPKPAVRRRRPPAGRTAAPSRRRKPQ